MEEAVCLNEIRSRSFQLSTGQLYPGQGVESCGYLDFVEDEAALNLKCSPVKLNRVIEIAG